MICLKHGKNARVNIGLDWDGEKSTMYIPYTDLNIISS